MLWGFCSMVWSVCLRFVVWLGRVLCLCSECTLVFGILVVV